MYVTRELVSNSEGPQVHSHVLGIVNGLITAYWIRLGEQLPLKGIIGQPVSTSYSYKLRTENVYTLLCNFTASCTQI